MREVIDIGVMSIVCHHVANGTGIGSDWSYTSWDDAASLIPYTEYYYKVDPMVPLLDKLPNGCCIRVQEMMDENDWIESKFYQGFQSASGMMDWASIKMHGADGSFYEFPVGDCGRGGLSQHKVDALNLLAPIIIESIETNNNFAMQSIKQSYGLEGVADQLGKTCFILDTEGKILEANSSGTALLRSGALFTDSFRTLSLRNKTDNAKFRRIVNEVVRHSITGGYTSLTRRAPMSFMMNVRDGWFSEYQLQLATLPAALSNLPLPTGLSRPCLVVTATNQNGKKTERVSAFAELHKLTKAETELVEILNKGRPLKDSAVLLNRTYNTVRSQLKDIFSKTRTRSQSQLMRAIYETQINLDAY